MKLIKEANWEDIFTEWRESEASDLGWIECATKVKGWPDWESWRRFSAGQIKAAERKWQIFEFDYPMKEIPEMLIGPFAGWQSRHPNKLNFSFADLLEIPDQFNFWKNHSKIRSLISNFPVASQFIGLIREDLGKIVCLEGHHRATAVALAAKNGLEISLIQPTIALAKLGSEENDLLKMILERGSSKDPIQ